MQINGGFEVFGLSDKPFFFLSSCLVAEKMKARGKKIGYFLCFLYCCSGVQMMKIELNCDNYLSAE